MKHLDTRQLEAAWPLIAASPKARGQLKMIVARPAENERKELLSGELDTEKGLVGDTWHQRPSSRMPDDQPHPDMQINIMNARVIELIAKTRDRWPLAGDQLYVDMDLSKENLPPGSILQIGEAQLQVTDIPHTGCKKFKERFGLDALRFVNSKDGKHHNLRGINAKVLKSGAVRQGDLVIKV